MPITPDQREARRFVIGSSDSAYLLGVNNPEWRGGLLDIWASKCLPLEPEKPEDVTEAQDLGNEHEAPLLRWAARQLGAEYRENVTTQKGIFASNHDALLVGLPEGLEAKVRTFRPEIFGEPGTDEIPEWTIVQCQHQMYTGDLVRVHVPVLLARFGRIGRFLYRVERSEELIAAIIAAGEKFWRDHVLTGVPPNGPLAVGDPEIFKRVRREPGTIAEVSAELVLEWEAAKAREKAAEKATKDAWARLLAEVGTAEGWTWGDPAGAYYTYLQYEGSRLDEKAIRAKFPRAAAKYDKTYQYRTPYKKNPYKTRRKARH